MGKIYKTTKFIAIYILLLLVWLFIRTFKSKKVLACLKKLSRNKVNFKQSIERFRVEDSCKIVYLSSRYHFVKITCLERAVTCALICWFRNINLDFCIGVKRFPFESHAWVEYNSTPFFEEEKKLKEYKVILKY